MKILAAIFLFMAGWYSHKEWRKAVFSDKLYMVAINGKQKLPAIMPLITLCLDEDVAKFNSAWSEIKK
jgi:hypothetical protein